jgi:hypothetical protein
MEESIKSDIPVLFCHVPQEGKPFSISEMREIIVRLVGIMVNLQYPIISDIPERKQGYPQAVAN